MWKNNPPRIYHKGKIVTLETVLPPQEYNFSEYAFKNIFNNIQFYRNMLNEFGYAAKAAFRKHLHKTGLPYLDYHKFYLDIRSMSANDILFERFLNLVDHNKNINTANYEDKYLCKICTINSANIVILPCTHMIMCINCLLKIDDNCPICRTKIDKFIHCCIDNGNDDDYKLQKRKKKMLVKNNKKRKIMENITNNKFKCKLCTNGFVDRILLPCTHMCVCSNCVKQNYKLIESCPICLKTIHYIICPIFL